MTVVTVKRPFVGHGFNMPRPGELIQVSEELAAHLLAADIVEQYETKVMGLGDVKKNTRQSASSPAARPRRQRTRKSSKRSVTK